MKKSTLIVLAAAFIPATLSACQPAGSAKAPQTEVKASASTDVERYEFSASDTVWLWRNPKTGCWSEIYQGNSKGAMQPMTDSNNNRVCTAEPGGLK